MPRLVSKKFSRLDPESALGRVEAHVEFPDLQEDLVQVGGVGCVLWRLHYEVVDVYF